MEILRENESIELLTEEEAMKVNGGAHHSGAGGGGCGSEEGNALAKSAHAEADALRTIGDNIIDLFD